MIYDTTCVTDDTTNQRAGVWLSLARAPGLGPGGRRFESCHPDEEKQQEMLLFLLCLKMIYQEI